MFLTVMAVLAAAVAAFLLGFALGKYSVYRKSGWGMEGAGEGNWGRAEDEERGFENGWESGERGEEGETYKNMVRTEEEAERLQGAALRRQYPGERWQGQRKGYERKGKKIWSVGSPVSGTVSSCREGAQPTLVIRPGENRLYAPVGGKVTKLYPLGNAFSFMTEFGAEMHMQVGESKDELLGCYYRPRVIQNEVVNKGKLLLEFDREALEAAGEESEVIVKVVNCAPGCSVKMTVGEFVKNGEEIFEVSEMVVTKART